MPKFDRYFIKYSAVLPRWMPTAKTVLLTCHLMLLCFTAALTGGFVDMAMSHADERTVDADYVLDMDLDDLMKAEVTSVSRYGKLHLDAPAAITVIDNAQIKNSGLREIPEILRLVPGLHVVRISANNWRISSRELPDLGAGKLLVLIDGRTIYSEDIGTTLWENQDVTLEDVDRIEVIRGPGGTLWGYNAVNGVVNIITKSARHTLGSLVDTGLADNGSYFAQVRHGLQLNRQAHMRLYYSQTETESFDTESGRSANDGLERQRGGFRMEYEPSDASRFVLEGEAAKTNADEGIFGRQNSESTTTQYHIRLEWLNSLSRDLNLSMQFYHDKEDYSEGVTSAGRIYGVMVQNMDGEIQIDWRIHRSHRLMLGGGYRYSWFNDDSDFNPELSAGLRFENDSAEWRSYNIFLNDEITLVPGKLWLTLGTKLEHHEETDWGWQPNARVLYKPKPNQSLWASASRALKRPAYADAATSENLFGGPFIDFFRGEPLEDETLTAYELGYRNQISPDLSIDLAAYYNLHDHIFMLDWQPIDEFSFEGFNNYETSAVAYGAELSVNWHPHARLNLMGSYTYFRTDYDVFEAWPGDLLDEVERHMVQLHASYSPTTDVDAAVNTYFSTESTYDITRLAAHTRLDLLLRWRLNTILELSLVGQNLLDDRHTELDITGDFGPDDPIQIPRSVYLELKAAF